MMNSSVFDILASLTRLTRAIGTRLREFGRFLGEPTPTNTLVSTTRLLSNLAVSLEIDVAASEAGDKESDSG